MRARWLLLAGSLVCIPARAEEAQTFELGWVRGPGAELCPSESSVAERVASRLGRKPFAERALHAIEASVTRSGERFTATIVARDATGATVGRRELSLDAPDCAAVADAVALAIALVIDPDAALAAKAAPAPSPPPATPEPPAPVAEPTPPLPCPAPPACPECRACPTPPSPAPETSLAVIARGGLATGALPALAPGLGLRATAGGETLRGMASTWFFPEQRAADERFAFGLAYGELGACAVILQGETLAFAGCGGLGIGAVHAVVSEVAAERAGQQLFVGAAAGPELGLRVAGALHVALGAELQVPLMAPKFYGNAAAEPVFQSSLGVLTWLGVGFELPHTR